MSKKLYVARLYRVRPEQDEFIKKVAAKLTKVEKKDISESEIIRRSVDNFNKN